MELKRYFFDTYAFFEIIKGNKNYIPYKSDVVVVTTKMNLMELHYGLLNEFGSDVADTFYNYYLPFAVEITDEIIKEASRFRSLMKGKRLSYVDCLGYTISKRRGIKFLTGDKEFKDIENVEYVK